MILTRYFNRELVHMTLAIVFILLVIVISNFFVRYLAMVSGGADPSIIYKFTVILIPKYVAYLIPLSFFFALLVVYGKFFANNELSVAFACGMSWVDTIKMVMKPALFLFAIELVLTLYVLPKVDNNQFLIQQTAAKTSLVSFIEPGKIVSFNDGQQVIYAKSSDRDGNLHDVFIYQHKNANDSSKSIITAPLAHVEMQGIDNQYLVLSNGYYYSINTLTNEVSEGSFKQANQFISGKIDIGKNTSKDATPTLQLLKEGGPENNAEFQWRLSFAFVIFVSTLIGLAVTKMRPRQSRYSKIVPAILIFIVYFNLVSLSKSWIAAGTIPWWIGIWWVHILFAGGALLWLKKHQGPLTMKEHAQ